MSEISGRIDDIRKRMGKGLLVLGHYYQRAEVLAHADAIGDSLELARRAAKEREAGRIVFCGVHFMAESADILSSETQAVYMPEPEAGCPMADMVSEAQAVAALKALRSAGGTWVPVVYVNSTAAVKAFCGREGGSTCTSSNAAQVFEWGLAGGRRVFFLPDEHLGINTARDMGMEKQAVVYDPERVGGGLSAAALRDARIVVWKGYCHVHTTFSVQQVRAARRDDPGALVIVHPETPKEVVAEADAHGSTSRIVRYVESAPAGATVYVGTEVHLVERLAHANEGRVMVKPLELSVCPNMYLTTEQALLDLLEAWPEANRVRVAPGEAADARKALDRMLSLSAG